MTTSTKTARSRIRAPYEILCTVIGHPLHNPESGERVMWNVDIDGARARIHDHRDDRPIGSTIFESPIAIWHVEAADDEQLTWICARLSERVIEAVAKKNGAKTLGPDEKRELNALLKQGVPLGEAMKRVQTHLIDSGARATYAWPMKDKEIQLFGQVVVPLVDKNADDDGDEKESVPAAVAASTSKSAPTVVPKGSVKPKVPVGPPIPTDMPRATVDAPFAKMVALLGAPEDKPIPFVSTRWRFVLDARRGDGREIVRHEDEPRDDPSDVDASIFDRISRFDDPFGSRSAATTQWTLISTSKENIERVLAWLDEKLRD